jgi:polyphenol oxidase
VIECREGACEFLRFERLGGDPSLLHAVFTRKGGVSGSPFASLNCSSAVGDDPIAVRRNQQRVADVLRLPLVAARPVHRNAVAELRPDDGAPASPAWREAVRACEADVMMTDVPGFALFWAYADCVPILLHDPRHHAIALVHAGWRGTALAVAARAVEAMRTRYGTRPGELLAGIAPSIGKCCYRVGEEVREQFRADATAWACACFEERDDALDGAGAPRLYLDLWESNRRQLLASGLAEEHVELADTCTGCRTDLFFSHRVERGGTGRFGVAIGLAGEGTPGESEGAPR